MTMLTEEAFLSFYEREADAIYRFALFKVGDRDHAKDVVQDAFVRTWEYAASGKDIGNFRAFLFRVAGNIIIDFYRKKKESSLDELSGAGFDAPDSRLPDTALRLDMAVALDALMALPEKYRDAVYLREVEGWSVRDLAEHFGISEGNVSVRIHRGAALLRERLASKEIGRNPSLNKGGTISARL